MYTRAYPLLAISALTTALAVASCGSGSKGSGGGGASQACTPMVTSVPGSATDPCPQTSPQCPAAMGYVAVSTCLATAAYPRDAAGNLMCSCVLRSTLGGVAGAGSTVSKCGNGMIDPPEQCDGALLAGQTCTSLGMGTGVLSCSQQTCTFNTSMCIKTGGVAGTAGH